MWSAHGWVTLHSFREHRTWSGELGTWICPVDGPQIFLRRLIFTSDVLCRRSRCVTQLWRVRPHNCADLYTWTALDITIRYDDSASQRLTSNGIFCNRSTAKVARCQGARCNPASTVMTIIPQALMSDRHMFNETHQASGQTLNIKSNPSPEPSSVDGSSRETTAVYRLFPVSLIERESSMVDSTCAGLVQKWIQFCFRWAVAMKRMRRGRGAPRMIHVPRLRTRC